MILYIVDTVFSYWISQEWAPLWIIEIGKIDRNRRLFWGAKTRCAYLLPPTSMHWEDWDAAPAFLLRKEMHHELVGSSFGGGNHHTICGSAGWFLSSRYWKTSIKKHCIPFIRFDREDGNVETTIVGCTFFLRCPCWWNMLEPADHGRGLASRP